MIPTPVNITMLRCLRKIAQDRPYAADYDWLKLDSHEQVTTLLLHKTLRTIALFAEQAMNTSQVFTVTVRTRRARKAIYRFTALSHDDACAHAEKLHNTLHGSDDPAHSSEATNIPTLERRPWLKGW